MTGGQSEADVCRDLSEALGLEFEGGGRLPVGDWSFSDCRCELGAGRSIFVEVERGQKHPQTNVLEYWPWLEQDPTQRILLIHLFDRNRSRRELTAWTAEKMSPAGRVGFEVGTSHMPRFEQ